MKKSLALIVLSLASVSAHADMIASLTMDVTCTPAQADLLSDNSVKIVSNAEGTTITAGGKVHKGKTISGGTEGGPFYAQYREGDISLDFFGGDMSKLSFTTRLIKKATFPVVISMEGVEEADSAMTCKGVLGIL